MSLTKVIIVGTLGTLAYCLSSLAYIPADQAPRPSTFAGMVR